jgi:alpha-1,2-glucosyltransferase
MKLQKTTILIVFFITLSICFISSYLYIQNAELFGDEKVHYPQIKKFINKDFTLHPKITTIPGYHAILALFAYIFNVSSIASTRLLSLIFSIASIPIFFLLSLKICKESSVIKTLQYCFFPILFPFFFLLYTDMPSLLMILISFYFLLNQKYKLAGIMGILSLFIRQNNIVWLAFMCVFIHFEKYNFEFSVKIFQKSIRDYWIFIIGFILFIIFLIINKGVAIGEKLMHPSFLFRTGNIFFMMFLFFFLFLSI